MFEKAIRKFQEKTTPILENVANTSMKTIVETVKTKASDSLPTLIVGGIFLFLIVEALGPIGKTPVSITYNFYGIDAMKGKVK